MSEQRLDIELAATDHMSNVFHKAGENARNEMNALERMNESIGRKSEFTHVLHALEGGGAAMGLGLASRMLSEMSEKAVKLKEELDSGDKSASDVAGEFARTIPILGGFVTTFDNIRELMTGEKAAAERMTEELKLQDEYVKARVESLKKEKEAYEELLKTVRAAKQEKDRVGLEPEQAAVQKLKDDEANRKTDAPTAEKHAVEEAKKRHEEEIKAANAKVKAAETEAHRARKDYEEERDNTGIFYERNESLVRQKKADADTADALWAQAARDRKISMQGQEEDIAKTVAGVKDKASADNAKDEAQITKLQQEQHTKAAAAEVADQIKFGEKTRETDRRIGQERIETLQAQGKEFDAERARIKLQYEKDSEGAGKQEKAALKEKYEADTAGVGRHEKEANAQRQSEAEKLAADAKKEGLQAQAELGNKAAEVELKRVEIAEKYREQHEKIMQLLRDENETAEQKAMLQKADTAAAAAEKQELANAGRNRDPVDYGGFNLRPAGEETGFRQAFAERSFSSNKASPEQLQQQGLDALTNFFTKALGDTAVGTWLSKIYSAVSGDVNPVS